jgi:hypothetical protein
VERLNRLTPLVNAPQRIGTVRKHGTEGIRVISRVGHVCGERGCAQLLHLLRGEHRGVGCILGLRMCTRRKHKNVHERRNRASQQTRGDERLEQGEPVVCCSRCFLVRNDAHDVEVRNPCADSVNGRDPFTDKQLEKPHSAASAILTIVCRRIGGTNVVTAQIRNPGVPNCNKRLRPPNETRHLERERVLFYQARCHA